MHLNRALGDESARCEVCGQERWTTIERGHMECSSFITSHGLLSYFFQDSAQNVTFPQAFKSEYFGHSLFLYPDLVSLISLIMT